jgi:hypothetical protein
MQPDILRLWQHHHPRSKRPPEYWAARAQLDKAHKIKRRKDREAKSKAARRAH